jgi:hypothetical protein
VATPAIPDSLYANLITFVEQEFPTTKRSDAYEQFMDVVFDVVYEYRQNFSGHERGGVYALEMALQENENEDNAPPGDGNSPHDRGLDLVQRFVLASLFYKSLH